MPIYQVTTPTGQLIVESVSQKDAIEFAAHDHFKAGPLTAARLAALLRGGAEICRTPKILAAETSEDAGQTDIEDHISKAGPIIAACVLDDTNERRFVPPDDSDEVPL